MDLSGKATCGEVARDEAPHSLLRSTIDLAKEYPMVVLFVLGILLVLGVVLAIAATVRAIATDGLAAISRVAAYDSRHPSR
ncbi:MAG: hypothetical protein NT132_14025 [Microbacterium sp.]|uniref:hypothetical protein n=1 Tax=Microbacterium sp. TaxID=51671 RepID=UPI002638CBC9|nr:hypothetical protein [Microbacterium sp.]MCX6503493.1 hypothetical protein [Microbacterium sp.]